MKQSAVFRLIAYLGHGHVGCTLYGTGEIQSPSSLSCFGRTQNRLGTRGQQKISRLGAFRLTIAGDSTLPIFEVFTPGKAIYKSMSYVNYFCHSR